MTSLVTARGVTKRFGNLVAVDNVSFSIDEGKILGLFGPNGAGKTTLLKAILGLTDCDGELSVLGYATSSGWSPTASTPYAPTRCHRHGCSMPPPHPNFSRSRVEELLARTKIMKESKVRELSKGMVTQLHLSIITAIDAKLLILDEPTLGLDIIFRKDFYANLLSDYFDEERTILITTHQVEEIENLLTDIMFINDGRILLDAPMDDLAGRYFELMTSGDNADKARGMRPLYEREVFGKKVMTFENADRSLLESLGELRVPSVADLFVAKVKGA